MTELVKEDNKTKKSSKLGYTKLVAEAQEKDRQKVQAINAEVQARVEELGKLLQTTFKSTKPTERHEVFIAEHRGKELRIGGALSDSVKRVLIIDTVTNTIVYNGNFTEEADAYVKIIKVYCMRTSKQSGFRSRQ